MPSRFDRRVTIVPELDIEAARPVMDAIKAAGLDPRKFGNHPQVNLLWQKWIDGEMTKQQFIDGVRALNLTA